MPPRIVSNTNYNNRSPFLDILLGILFLGVSIGLLFVLKLLMGFLLSSVALSLITVPALLLAMVIACVVLPLLVDSLVLIRKGVCKLCKSFIALFRNKNTDIEGESVSRNIDKDTPTANQERTQQPTLLQSNHQAAGNGSLVLNSKAANTSSVETAENSELVGPKSTEITPLLKR